MQKSRIYPTIIICAIATAIWASPAMAEEEYDVHQENAEHHDSGSHHDFKNGLSIFLGATDEPGHGNEPTWGLEYGRVLSDRWTIGGLLDYAGGAQRNMVIAPAVFWKPFGGGFVLLAAPGFEVHSGRDEVDHHLLKVDAGAVDEDKTYFVMRFGAAYYFHFGSRYGIGPTVNLDLVNGHEVWVYGVNFEVGF